MRQWFTPLVAGGCLFYLLCFGALGQGQRPSETPKLSRDNCADPSATMDVTSERMTFDQQAHTFTFDGKVRVHHCDMVMTCNRLHVVNDAKGAQVTQVTALGDVHFQRGARHVVAERAEFFPAEQRLVLTGNPRAWDTQEQQEMTGEEMIVFLHDENMLVKRARVLFRPRKVVSKVP